MTVLQNEDRWQRSNVSIDHERLVTSYDKHSSPGSHAYIDYGMLLLRHELFAPGLRPKIVRRPSLLERPSVAGQVLSGGPDEREHGAHELTSSS